MLRFASAVVCNSRYTADVFRQSFKSLGVPNVLYPCVAVPDSGAQRDQSTSVLLSLNRYERKKNIRLAIDVLAIVRRRLPKHEATLVIAGGYDPRLKENVAHFEELQRYARDAGVMDYVTFKKNVSDSERNALLGSATAVLYTPPHEHFGIVPLESMAAATPVIAVNTGGPVETIEHGLTGYLCENNAGAFADALVPIIKDPELARRIGVAGRQMVSLRFSQDALGGALSDILQTICVQ